MASLATIGPDARVRAGQFVAVSVRAKTEDAASRAVVEARRHVRAAALLGQFFPIQRVQWIANAGAWQGYVAGETWREPGEEYTAGELTAAIRTAVPGVTVAVFAVVDADTMLGIADSVDPRRAGGETGALTQPVTRTLEVAERTVDAAGNLVDATSRAASGIADLAMGAGQGAQGVGAFLGQFPLLAFAVTVGVGVFAIRVLR